MQPHLSYKKRRVTPFPLGFFSFRGGDLISHHINAEPTAGSPLPLLPLPFPPFLLGSSLLPPYGPLIAAKAIPNILAREQLTKKREKKGRNKKEREKQAC